MSDQKTTMKVPLRFEGSKGERMIYALFDSGATFSCINEEYAHEVGNPEQLWTPLLLLASAPTAILFISGF